MRRIAAAVVAAWCSLVSFSALAWTGCDLWFDDGNNNGLGSVEGYCGLDIPFDTLERDGSPSLRLELEGDRGSRRVIFSARRLPVSRVDGPSGRPQFWDRNRNGDGFVQGQIVFRNVEDWSERYVRVSAIVDGRRYRVFDGFLRR